MWLSQWPSNEEMYRLFPTMARSMANGFLQRESQLALQFSKMSLIAYIGPFCCTWKLDKEGHWGRRCTCGAPGACSHAYAAHLMLKTVCRQEGWPLAANATPARPASASSASCPSVLSAPVAPVAPLVQTTFFEAMESHPVSVPASLEVELDFPGSGGDTSVKFYVTKGGRRELQRLAWIRNYAYELKSETESHPASCEWSARDREFLLWLLPSLRRFDIRSLELNTIHLSNATLREWLKRWKYDSNRFIDRKSGMVMECLNYAEPVKMQAELYEHSGAFRLGMLMVMSDGRKLHVHKLKKAVRDDRTGFIMREMMRDFKPPIPWSKLFASFGEGVCRLPRANTGRELERLLDGHLELLADSPLIRRVTRSISAPVVEAAVNELGEFQVSVSVNGKQLRMSGDERPFGGAVFRGRHLNVVSYDSKVLDGVFASLRALAAGDVKTVERNGRLCIAGSPGGAAALVKFWKGLPIKAVRRTTRQTRRLLRGRVRSGLRVSLEKRGKFVELSAVCRCGDTDFPLSHFAGSAASPYVQNSLGDWFAVDEEALARSMSALASEGLDGKPTLMLPNDARDTVSHLLGASAVLDDASVPLAAKLRREVFAEAPPLPSHLEGVMRPYQKAGFDFLAQRTRYGIGAILADDMGLGKTLQVLALLEAWKDALASDDRPFRALVVSPASVVDIWSAQARQFCPALKTRTLRGTREQRERIIAEGDADVLLTHYGLARTDAESLGRLPFTFVVLDEAQNIKNPDAQVTAAVRSIPSDCRVALTGTPLENRLTDLWSIMDYLNCGIYGSRDSFEEACRTNAGHSRLMRRLSLLMLRRSKSLVAPELPPRTEETVRLEMPPEMRELYEREQVRARRNSGSMMALLGAITRLRRFCCAPELVVSGGETPVESPKLSWLLERLEELLSGGHSVLVFSQFTSMLSIIGRALETAGITYRCITGETPVPQRAELVQDFNESAEASVFLLSLKAAGTGLTLTRADYVFLFDPWWNPSTENQAIDRTHRIGQTRPVFAYRIILADSIEEKVLEIIQHKRELFASVIDGAEAAGDTVLTAAELRGLLSS